MRVYCQQHLRRLQHLQQQRTVEERLGRQQHICHLVLQALFTLLLICGSIKNQITIRTTEKEPSESRVLTFAREDGVEGDVLHSPLLADGRPRRRTWVVVLHHQSEDVPWEIWAQMLLVHQHAATVQNAVWTR